MAHARKTHLYTIPPHRAFSDALAAGLIRRFGDDPMGLARGLVLLPNNRAKRAISDAFVRASGKGLLLPRLVAIGDPELDEAVGAVFDPADDSDPVPPAVPSLQRRMVLARLLVAAGGVSDAGEAIRLAGDLGRTLDQLLVEEVSPQRIRDIDVGDLTEHWQRSLRLFDLILTRWPDELARLGRVDLAERRARLLGKVADRWRATPPPGFVCAAGITTSAPAIARLLRVVSEMPQGMVVLPGLATGISDREWDIIGPHAPDPVTGRRKRAIETHPQYHLKLLLDRMGVQRGEFRRWLAASEYDAPSQRSRAIASAMAPPELTHGWNDLSDAERHLPRVMAIELATPAAEAQAIALKLREALETPERTAALVTPDRALARRVAGHLARWKIDVDDTAGRPLSMLPPGTLLLELSEAAAQDFAPLSLLALLKHPLVRPEARLPWLEGARRLDLALRGPRPASGLAGIDRHLAQQHGHDAHLRKAARPWWQEVRPAFEPIAAAWAGGDQPLPGLLDALRETATALCGDDLWSRADGRAAADLLDELEARAGEGPSLVDPASIPAMLRTLMDEVAVRPPQGGHPRLAILGLLEARLQTADLMILGGLNEGVWPGLPAPDPWLAPRIRAELDLPGLERRIGLAAHDFAGALGAQQVLLTRARRDASAPTIASRFWLRLQALSGGLARDAELAGWLAAIDDPGEYQPQGRPGPAPPAEARPKVISVTEVDRLKADPYAFYARRMLALSPLDPVDADPSAAWRGTAAHEVLEKWFAEDGCDPARLHERARAMFAGEGTHPLMRALWQPRLMEAIDWIAKELTRQMAEGRTVLGVEQKGSIQFAGVRLTGKYDRIDRMPDGTLGIVDYKSGKPPSAAAVQAGYSLQLGLIGLIAERGGFAGISGIASCFEYWSLAKNKDQFGFITTPVDPEGKKRNRIRTADFVTIAADNFFDVAADWLTGDRPFTAKLHPEYAPYAEYDQLMRRDEWVGRD
ncbi:double-strand break repair protein AddB [Stakelama tenebrarum]|uniref:Double-strand break repair protein AddB n=1 Tax=Stakelama tenebrarum TaxID=2711215 RepID=A0A6G6Y5Q9_9SPHN|nr:double-strand break repair protein AddB [Sphingosinithalassobacter tenebrarum]QIG80058.1 double-strand break repair protein AddB [Sphingosinithalassobacter tenebrarum]